MAVERITVDGLTWAGARFNVLAPTDIPDGTSEISAALSAVLRTANEDATIIDDILGEPAGDESTTVTLIVTDANTTIANNDRIVTGTGGNVAAQAGAAYIFVWNPNEQTWHLIGGGTGGGALQYPLIDGEAGLVENLSYAYDDFRRYGVVAGSLLSQTDKLNKGILAVNLRGGGPIRLKSETGLVYVNADLWGPSAGTAETGGVGLLDNVRLIIEEGAALKALPVPYYFLFPVASAVVLVPEGVENWSIIVYGRVIGERNEHVVPEGAHAVGEGGYGIATYGAGKGYLAVYGWVEDCHGDGVFIGSNDRKDLDGDEAHTDFVSIPILNVRRCRRQGISVLASLGGVGALWNFEDIGGTNPGAGVDFEPQFMLHGGYGAEDATPGYARVENWTVAVINVKDSWRGFVAVAGVQGIVIGELHTINCVKQSFYAGGFPEDGRPNTGVQIGNFLFDHKFVPVNEVDGLPDADMMEDGDTDSVQLIGPDNAESPLDEVRYIVRTVDAVTGWVPRPIVVVLTNPNLVSMTGGRLQGKFYYGVWVKGFGSSSIDGRHNLEGITFEGDGIDCLKGLYATNVADKINVPGCKFRRLFVGAEFDNSDQVSGHVDAENCIVGVLAVNGSDDLDVVLSAKECNESFKIVSSVRPHVRITSAGATGRAIVLDDAQDGVYDVMVSGSARSFDDTDPQIALLNGSSGNRFRGTARLGAFANRPKYAVATDVSSVDNEFSDLDMRGAGATADWSFAEGSQIMSPRTGFDLNGDEDVMLTAFSKPKQMFDDALTVDRVLTIAVADMFIGWRAEIIRGGGGAGKLTIQTDAPVTLKEVPAATNARVVIEWDGTALRLTDYNVL